MADRVEVLITGDSSGLVRAADQASSAMAGFGSSASKLSSIASAFKSDFGQMTAAFATANVAVGAIVGAFDSAARAVQAMNAEVIDAERVSSKLTATFAGAEGAAARLTAQAEALAGSTVFFDDDAIKSAAAALRAFDLTEKQISQLLPVAVNLATVFGTDLDSAAQKLALGLNGSTRGLREFGIVTKEGATQAEVMAEILKRGEQAAKGAATAQSGLRGATEGLKKAQGEFNQALGNLLAGPQAGLLNFLSSAINKATELTGALSGVTSATIAVSKVINPKTGQIEAGPAVPTVRPGQRFGEIPGLAMSAAGRAMAERALGGETAGGGLQKPAKEPEAPRAPRAPRAARAVAAPQEVLGPGIELLQNYQRQQLENLINANIRAGEEQLKFTAAAEDLADDRQKARNQELSRAYDDAAERFASITNKSILDGIDAAASILEAAIKGEDIARPLLNAAPKIAGDIAAFIPGVSERAVSVIERATQAGLSLLEAAFTRFNTPVGMADSLVQGVKNDIETAKQLEEAARRRLEQEKANRDSAAEAMGREQDRREAVLKGPLAEMVQGLNAKFSKIFEAGSPMALSATAATKALGGMSPDQLKNAAELANTALTGTGEAQQKASVAFEKIFGFAAELPGVGKEIALSLIEKYGPNAQPSTEEAGQLGDSARNPVYVFDVSPSKDEFTRAPRSLFFRPAQAPRAVSGGQAIQTRGVAPTGRIAGISGGSSKRYG